MHFVDFAIFLLVMCCFEFFSGTIFRSDSSSEEAHGYAEGAWWLVVTAWGLRTKTKTSI